jgi:hypothetical protein
MELTKLIIMEHKIFFLIFTSALFLLGIAGYFYGIRAVIISIGIYLVIIGAFMIFLGIWSDIT